MSVNLTVQILAMGLTISQLIAGKVQDFRTNFNPDTDQALVAKLFHAGCVEGLKDPDDPTKPFDIDPFLEEFAKDASTAPSFAAPGAPAPTAAEAKMQAKIAAFDFKALRSAYRQLCKQELPSLRVRRSLHPRHKVDQVGAPVDLRAVINFYNESFKGIPSVAPLKNFRYEQSTTVLDGADGHFTDMYKKGNNRRFVSLKSLPPHVAQAFISAEDKDFYKHRGVDMKGIMRAAISSMGASDGKRAAGGSTIPQQMIKNVYKADDYTFGRKMREMYMATEAEAILTKDQIIEIYLNVIPLGRDTAGIEMAAQVYFGKHASELSISESAFLAGINKGPNFYNPDKGTKRQELVEERRQYVLKRMAEDAYDTSGMKYTDGIRVRAHRAHAKQLVAEINKAKLEKPKLVPVERASAFYFVDQVHRQIKTLQKDVPELANYDEGGYIVHSTINPEIQRKAEIAIQNGLARYEQTTGRAQFTGPVGSIAKRVEGRTWQEVMTDVKANVYYDVHWPLAVVLPPTPAPGVSCGKSLAVGLKDGSVTCLDAGKVDVSRLAAFDLVFARRESKQAKGVKLLIPPSVQGAMVILENKTGRVLGMVGGFSYGASQLNRVTKTARQPGSTIKPFTYLYALNRDYQPNTLISDTPQEIPPIRPGGRAWNPRNYDRNSGGLLTLRAALENSINVATANAMAGIPPSAADTLDGICALTKDLGIYRECEQEFPFILGAQKARLIDMAQAYATIANLGLRPTPYLIEGVERGGRAVWTRQPFGLKQVPSADQVSFYQLRRMMEGVVQRGTAKALNAEFGPRTLSDGRQTSTLLAAKTGTSESENDAWFIGFSNEYTVATWVGYDNPDNKHRRTLGKGQTGGTTAMPMALDVLRYLKQTRGMAPLQAPPESIRAMLGEQRVNSTSGEVTPQGDLVEIFRLDQGAIIDSRMSLRGSENRLSKPVADGDQRATGEDTEAPTTATTEQNFENPAEPHYEPSRDDPYRDDRRVDPNYRALQQRYGF